MDFPVSTLDGVFSSCVMRIRTIKPEFWTSETIAPLSDKAKLLAIGLLNFADDEGYFWANPVLIRAALFPFEDESKTILGWLQELSRGGYIVLGEREDDGRSVGKVVNFLLHQRIDKPKPSIIKQNCKFQDESKKSPRLIQDESCLEGNGKEQGKEGSPVRPPDKKPPEPELVEIYTPESRIALYFLNEKTGKHFREMESSLAPINARLKENGVTIEGVKQMIARQCAMWMGTRMQEYLRPETLFGKEKFENYYASRELPVELIDRKAEQPKTKSEVLNGRPVGGNF